MTPFRRRAEEALWLLGLHPLARSLNVALHPEKRRRRQRMRAFYGDLLPNRSLVFDVGANVGDFSALFSQLGHRVVAVEPNTDCIRHIELSYGLLPLTVVHAVLGPTRGLATLNICDSRDDLSSVRRDWIPQALPSRQVSVAMLTLDDLVVHFGQPDFIKVDVEGAEESVIDGLTLGTPGLFSFEFNSKHLDVAFRCLDKPHFSGALFNYAMGDPQHFEMPTWVDAADLKEALTRADGYGDVFAKRPGKSFTRS